MQNYCGQFKGLKITLMGLGLLGRGIGDARFLAECGANLTVTDLKHEIELVESVEQLKGYENITFVLGEHREEDFVKADLVLKAPATPFDSPYIQAAEKADVHVTMSTALFAQFAQEHGVTIVGVTGTRGKTTVAHMIYETLKGAGKKVHLGGNIRGMSTLELFPEIQEGDIVVLELDSWQLQGFAAEKISPNVAVFTNLMPDHLNYYPDLPAPRPNLYFVYALLCDDDSIYIGQTQDIRKRWQRHKDRDGANHTKKHKPVKLIHYEEFSSRSEAVQREKWLKTGVGRKWLHTEWNHGRTRQAGMDLYFADKAHIFEHQDLARGDTLIVGDSVLEDIRAVNPPVEPIDATPIPEEWQLKVPGLHNRENAAFAREALSSLGIPEEDIKKGLTEFQGVEGRLEFVTEKGGVKIYNDNNATTPQATIAAIKSFPENDVVLIAGGTDKGISLELLVDCLQTSVKKVVLLDETATGTQKLAGELPHAIVAKTMDDAVKEAFDHVETGDVLLFSPGFSSFGIFKNEYDRNDQFKKVLKQV